MECGDPGGEGRIGCETARRARDPEQFQGRNIGPTLSRSGGRQTHPAERNLCLPAPGPASPAATPHGTRRSVRGPPSHLPRARPGSGGGRAERISYLPGPRQAGGVPPKPERPPPFWGFRAASKGWKAVQIELKGGGGRAPGEGERTGEDLGSSPASDEDQNFLRREGKTEK